MSNAVTVNMSFVDNNGECEGGVNIKTSDGLDISSESKGTKDEVITNMFSDLLDKMLLSIADDPEEEEVEDEEDECDGVCLLCDQKDECDYFNDKDDELEEISKEAFLLEALEAKNDMLTDELARLEKRLAALEGDINEQATATALKKHKYNNNIDYIMNHNPYERLMRNFFK